MTKRRWFLSGALFALAGTALLAWVLTRPATSLNHISTSFPNGVASGDVTQENAVLWARSTLTGVVAFHYGLEHVRATSTITRSVLDPMQPVTVTLDGLTPGTRYRYRVENASGEQVEGRFRTPHEVGHHHGLRFGVSGDWRGDLSPYPAIANLPERDLDFFVALGDTIYADIASPALAQQAETVDDFRRKHEEVYATRFGVNSWAEARASTPLLITIDDHEVLNDFAGGADAARDRRFPETEGRINESARYRNALQALHEYNPLRGEVYENVNEDRSAGRPKLYRYQRYGSDAALFLLDGRSFRDLPISRADPNDPADVARFRVQLFRPERTLLGAQQLADLKRDLLDAQQHGITWKFVATPEPIQYLGLLSAQDRWEGYASERSQLLRFIDEHAIQNVVFIAADIHGTVINNLSYQQGPDQPQLPTHAFEVTSGPVAFAGTYGHAVVSVAERDGFVTATESARYQSLPVRPDPDSVVDDKDDFVKKYVDRQLIEFGTNPIGLDGSLVEATLLEGDYIAVHTFGWTEFEIDKESQELTVTIFGVEPYSRANIASDLEDVLARHPVVVGRFSVRPFSQ